MLRVTLDLPEEVFSALRRSPEKFARDLRLASRPLSTGTSEERSPRKRLPYRGVWTGLTFSLRLARERANAFVVNFDDLKRELERG